MALGFAAGLGYENPFAFMIQSLDRILRRQPVNRQHFFRTFKPGFAERPHIPESNHLGNVSRVITHPTRVALNLDSEARFFLYLTDGALHPGFTWLDFAFRE